MTHQINLSSMILLVLFYHVPLAFAGPSYVSGFYTSSGGNAIGFIRDPQRGFTSFSVPRSTDTFGNGINASLQVSGFFDGASGSHGLYTRFWWRLYHV